MLKRLTEKRVKTFWGYDCNIEKMEKLINDFIDCDKELDSVQLGCWDNYLPFKSGYLVFRQG